MSANTDSDTRSSSPATSESLSDEQNQLEAVDFSAWCHPFPDPDDASFNEERPEIPKFEDKALSALEALLREQAFNPVTSELPLAVDPAVFQLSQPRSDANAALAANILSSFSSDNSSSESAPVPDLIPRTTMSMAMGTKVVPPPPVQPRKVENIPHRVTFPPKESCYNLAILTPNIAPSGTKSRVETQVRVALDLAVMNTSSGGPSNYDTVGSWKWLRLPKGTATRKRSRKEGKIDASPVDTLFLNAEVTCASNPNKQVFSCSTCQGREAKRVARKIAARVRPTRSESDSNDGDGDSSKIIQFNCPDTLDFSGGSVVLPLRITCYCRHHREKVGFNVHFTVKDVSGRVIGKGMSPPIMITDDHKSTDKSAPKQLQAPSYLGDADWEPRTPMISIPCESASADTIAPSRRRQSGTRVCVAPSKRRPKPYDSPRASSDRPRRREASEGNTQSLVDALLSPASTSYSDASAFTSHNAATSSVFSSTVPSSPASQSRDGTMAFPLPLNSNTSPISTESSFMENQDTFMHEALAQSAPFFPLSPPDTAPSSPPTNVVMPRLASSAHIELSSFTYNLLHPQPEPPNQTFPAPKIHRLIPSSGPTFGGIEVTVLGSNFHASVPYSCVFGEVVASSTSRWSENTLVCILPPRACAGVVPVTLEGMKLDGDSENQPALFTYTNETDRTLMELALQVVGLKMTGKIEDAKDIAMRIVGTTAEESQSSSLSAGQMMNLASGALSDSRCLFLGRADDVEFEKIVMDSLSALDVRDRSGEPSSLMRTISHPTKTRQTLLHLAASLNLPSLVEFLIQRDIRLDAQDINGYTALHFAVLNGSRCCTRQIVNAGADTTLHNNMGYTAFELSPEGSPHTHLGYESESEESDDESHFGDVEEDSSEESRPRPRVHFKRRVRHPLSRRSSMPASVTSAVSDNEEPLDFHATVEDDDNATVVSPDSSPMLDPSGKESTIDDKQAASFADFLQRTWAQFQAPHLVPQMPQFPGMPAWAFPVFVPMQVWPPFRFDKREEEHDSDGKASDARSPGNEWRISWERWMNQMSAAMARQNQLSLGAEKSFKTEAKLDVKPGADDVPKLHGTPTPVASRSILRRFGYGQRPPRVQETEVKAYSYRPRTKSLVRNVKKEDRMLVFFWIPIMILAIGWALYKSFPPAICMLKQYIPVKEIVGRLTKQ
ncbi:hypothetical protein M0805_001713 [Coniferiporia weirii]|nr:hypothetical protein M0805_001713 [Coniferiporia weirii]